MSMHHFVAHFLKVVYGYAPWRRWVEYDFVSIIVRPVIATDSIIMRLTYIFAGLICLNNIIIFCNETLMNEWQYTRLNISPPNLEMPNKHNAEVVFEMV